MVFDQLRKPYPLLEKMADFRAGVVWRASKLIFIFSCRNRLIGSWYRLHLLSEWFQLLSGCSDACLVQFYDPLNNCFRQEKLNQFIVNILEPVKDFDFSHLEPALIKGLTGV